MDIQEINKKMEDLGKKIIDDPEHFEKHFDNLHHYLEGLKDLSVNPIDKGTIPLLQLSLVIFRSVISVKNQQEQKNAEFTSNINNLLSRLDRVEKEQKTREEGR